MNILSDANSPSRAALISDPYMVDRTIEEALADLEQEQRGDGHWVFELEADVTIPSEYIFLNHFLGDIDDEVERKLAAYIRRQQSSSHHGWPLYHDGEFNISASVKGYFALKLVGDDPDAPHMRRAREAILAYGGAERANVFTRFALSLFEQTPWHAVPVMRPEAMLLPRWSPFHIEKVSYWSRTVMIPMFVLYSMRARAKNPRGVSIAELFTRPPFEITDYNTNPTGSGWGEFFLKLDKVVRFAEPIFPKLLERRGVARCVSFVKERLNGEDGLGAIFPAMANTVMMYRTLGYPEDHPDYVIARKSIDNLLILKEDEGYCQPCVSPIWDTALAAHAVAEAHAARDGSETPDLSSARAACDWLVHRQITEVFGDYAWKKRDLKPGGWAFQYNNDHYPDVDDTAVVAMAMDRVDPERYADAIQKATDWIIGMQSENGGWGAFDIDNTHYVLNNIPFADHGALLDPPTSDVSARCISMLAQLGYDRSHPVMARGLDYLKNEQEPDGSWFGRWGTNYIYGTWSVLCAINAAGEDMQSDYVRKAVNYLESMQREDGGWGEDGASYWDEHRGEGKESTASQTAWALLGLMAAGEVDSEAVERGIAFLLQADRNGMNWKEEWFTAVGFPRIFYLRYHGYAKFFPLWAIARYRNLKTGNARLPMTGM